jgi:hypothetical protein
MTFAFSPAVRLNTPMIIGIAGPSGSGKTYTALTLAMGLGGKVALIDTEGRRALHYADLPVFKFDHCDMEAPYTPSRFLEAMLAASDAGYQVIVVDSFSDEYVGEGGLVDMADAELRKMRVPNAAAAWAMPKARHKLVVRWMRQSRCHLIFCLRAEEKVRLEKAMKDGREQTVVVPIGWQPICEKNVPYEMATSFMLTPDAPGVPRPIKIQEQHRHLFPLDRQITGETGKALAEWCLGGRPVESPTKAQEPPSREKTTKRTRKAEAPQAPPGEALLAMAYDVAGDGTEALRFWWSGQPHENQVMLKEVLDKYLKPLAAEADEMLRNVETPDGVVPQEADGVSPADSTPPPSGEMEVVA